MTEWLKFFRFSYGAGDFQSFPHRKMDREEFMVRSLPLDVAQDLWNNPSWTKAVFFRDPAERLLSAYLDKIAKEAYTQKVFRIGTLEDESRPVLTFEEFVDLLSTNNTSCIDPSGLHTCSDPHWKPQYLTCGLDVTLPLMDFVGNFNHLAVHTKLLLDRVGMWDTYGRFYDHESEDGKIADSCEIPPPALNESLKYGFNQRDLAQVNEHATGSQTKMDMYYTPEIMAKVRKAYEVDFAIWDDISKRSLLDVAKGSDLKHVRSYCQKQGIDLETV
jgi:hypothetical protein